MKGIGLVLATFAFGGNLALAAESTAVQQKLDELRARGQMEGWTFQVGETSVANVPLHKIAGFKVPKNWREHKMFVTPKIDQALPAAYDWREQGSGLTPIKDQGMCGSCWAFSTVATFQDAIMIKDNQSKDLSEQYLVSCNKQSWGCNGGFWAHDMHQNPGSVLSSEFPYQASDVACKPDLHYGDKLTSWAYIGDDNSVPKDEALKAAIMTYGPISVAVNATDSFQFYSGGVFNDCTADGDVNHAVNLVGWNDKEGYWIMRNSWGNSWGEAGYMKIKYGCNKIGFAATSVVYKPACANQPVASTGVDQVVAAGQSVDLGVKALVGTKYSWSPAEGLDNPNSATPKATVSKDTVYTLRAQTECGVAVKSVKISVR